MNFIRNKLRLIALYIREWKLQAEASHTADLIADYQAVYAREIAELRAVRIEIAQRAPAEVLLKDAVEVQS